MGNNLSLKSVFLPCGISPPCGDSYFSLDGDDIQKNVSGEQVIVQNKNYHSTSETMSNPYSLTHEEFTVAEISTCDFCKNENIKVHRIQTIGNDKNYYLVCRACNNICNNEIYI